MSKKRQSLEPSRVRYIVEVPFSSVIGGGRRDYPPIPAGFMPGHLIYYKKGDEFPVEHVNPSVLPYLKKVEKDAD